LGVREKKDDRTPVSGGYCKWASLVIGGSLNNTVNIQELMV
jgi:hypothetical protein